MTAPPRTEPPYVPIRTSGWPVRHPPRWLAPAVVVLLAIAVAVGLSHRPSSQERATDLRGFLHTMTYDVGSCAAGVPNALTALRDVDAGTGHSAAVAAGIADSDAANCSPANNELIDDLESYEVPESLASYHLQNAVTGLINWTASDAGQVQSDVANVLTARGTPAEAAARAALARATRKMNAQRAAINKVLTPAIRSLSPQAAAPVLPG